MCLNESTAMVEIKNDGVSDVIANGMRVGSSYRQPSVAVVPLAAVDTAGGLFSWQNPESGAIIIDRVELDVTTAAAGVATADIGTTATSGTTSTDNLIDGLDVNTAAGVFDNLGNAGTNGKTRQKLAAGKWVTGSKATGTLAGIVGNAYIFYHPI